MLANYPRSTGIGLLNENPLHSALKKFYAQYDERFEVKVDGFVIDIVRGDLLIEIQTGNFSSIKRKLFKLVVNHPVRLVYPIACEKWIIKLTKEGEGQTKRRKSPKRGAVEDLFKELVSFPELLLNPNFSLDVVLIQEEDVRRYNGKRGWRRRGLVTEERRLLKVVEQRLFEKPTDVGALIPKGLSKLFTTSDLAEAMKRPRWFAQKMTYCLRKMMVIVQVGKQDRSVLYSRTDTV